MPLKLYQKYILVGGLLLSLLLLFPKTVSAATIPYKITDGFNIPVVKGQIFFTTELKVNYQTGRIIFSSNQEGIGDTVVDDAIEITVIRPDGSIKKVNYSYYSAFCWSIIPQPPKDITSMFLVGENSVKIKMYDVCGLNGGSWPLYLVNLEAPDPPSPAPSPFLDLPWDYKSKGLSFNEAALAINSFFDHEYPLLSSGIVEPPTTSDSIVNYLGFPRVDKPYSSHDGYDYGRVAKALLGEPVLAAASGWATYSNLCSACGNAVHIDHGNGYQTRYYHLLKDGLITNTPGQKIWVEAGQQIGLVGSTGRSTGAHIHFMVIEDKNKDGDFDDNIPDGITDPFGWQSSEEDPWPKYEFFYNGQKRTGNKSYYLWKHSLDNLDASLESNGGIFKVGRVTLQFPPGSTNQSLNLSVKTAASINQPTGLSSIGSIIYATAKDSLGNIVRTFFFPYTIIIDFGMFDISRFKPETISIYSSEDGITWTKENTQIKDAVAKASVNHMSYFALMGERKDIIPPTTSPYLEGQQGQLNWFRSDVQVKLIAHDNDGGLGVDYTLYKLNGQDWEIYQNPLTFTNEGHYVIEFYSVDNDENIEEVKSVEFTIDKTSPQAFIDANPKTLWPPNSNMVNIIYNGHANDDNLYSTLLIIDDEYDEYDDSKTVDTSFNGIIPLKSRRYGSDKDGRIYIIKVVAEDLAGNLTEHSVQVSVPHNQENNR